MDAFALFAKRARDGIQALGGIIGFGASAVFDDAFAVVAFAGADFGVFHASVAEFERFVVFTRRRMRFIGTDIVVSDALAGDAFLTCRARFFGFLTVFAQRSHVIDASFACGWITRFGTNRHASIGIGARSRGLVARF